MSSARVDRRLHHFTKNGQTYPNVKAQDWLDAIRKQVCPLCGEGPFVIVAVHVARRHGMYAAELRDLLGFDKSDSICDEDYSELARKRLKERQARGEMQFRLEPGSETARKIADKLSGRVSPNSGKRMSRQRTTVRRVPSMDSPPERPKAGVDSHGSLRGYRAGCRCEPCRAWNREYHRTEKAKRLALVSERGLPEGVAHGLSAYNNWGCRCDVCFEAQRSSNALLLERRRAARAAERES